MKESTADFLLKVVGFTRWLIADAKFRFGFFLGGIIFFVIRGWMI